MCFGVQLFSYLEIWYHLCPRHKGFLSCRSFKIYIYFITEYINNNGHSHDRCPNVLHLE